MSADERGMALPLALFALVVIGALVAGAFAGAVLEQRVGQNTLYGVQAAEAAEAGAAAVVGAWDSHGLGSLLPGQVGALAPVRLPGGTRYEPSVQRLNPELFELRVTGTRLDAEGGTLARRGLTLVLRRADSALSGAATVVPLASRAWSSP